MTRNKLSIIIPILNEISHLPSLFKVLHSYSKEINIIFCDAGSVDGSHELISLECKKNHYSYFYNSLKSPSVMSTIELAKDNLRDSQYVMVHPVDAHCEKAITKLLSEINMNKDYYLFYKSYSPSQILLNIQEFYLNKIRLGHQKQFVWTNCPVFKIEFFHNILRFNSGFLEDVLLSDYMKEGHRPVILKEKVIISSRRYLARKTPRQILRNFYIMISFRLKLKSIEELKSIYYK